jgi:hypothetical protein
LSGSDSNESLRKLIRAISREVVLEALDEHVEDFEHVLRETDEVETEIA